MPEEFCQFTHAPRARGLIKTILAPFAKWLCFTVALLGAAGSARAQTLADAALVQALGKGGYVLVMRHASSPSAAPDKAAANPDNINAERQLDEAGRKAAQAMGDALKKLRIPIGDVQSSPTYRALETVRIAAFGKAKAIPELGDGGQGMMADTAGIRSNWLKNAVSETPPPGSNTLIVTHMPNIVGAFGQAASDIKEGETLVFQFGEDGTATMRARVKIEEWPLLAAKQR